MPATPVASCGPTHVTLADGRRLVSFGGCNYLGLAGHPEVLDAVRTGLERFGLSVTASRETTGNTTTHEALEAELAAFLELPRALLVPDGYLANVAACQGLCRVEIGAAILDERAHRSLQDAAQAAGLRSRTFPHARAEGLSEVLAREPGPCVVMTDGVFTADGEPARLRALLAALRPEDRLLVDDCHGLGVVGPGGRGSVAAAGLRDSRIVVTTSLAKGLGCAGGIVVGPRGLIEACACAAAYVCTTPIAPALGEGARAALGVLSREPGRVVRLRENAARLRAGLGALGLLSPEAVEWATPVAAFTTGDEEAMRSMAEGLAADGFRVSLQRYPGGPADSYFRLSVGSEHTTEEIDALLSALASRIEAPTTTPTHATNLDTAPPSAAASVGPYP
jgi:8-amino-7-oxononanoate synthase